MTDNTDNTGNDDGANSEKVSNAHELVTALRNDGYTVGFDASDVVDEFDENIEKTRELLDGDELAGYFLVAARDGRTDYSSSVVVDDPVVHGVTQIQMLGAHFRVVLEHTGLDTSSLVDAMVDEAITIDEPDEQRGDR